MKHVNGADPCPSCEDKLIGAHPDIAQWFREAVKPLHNDCHISWAFRDKENQEQAFLEGKSKLHFPLSAHNKSDDQGNPCAQALDLFQIVDGLGVWPYKYFKQIADEAHASSAPIKWGGNWKSLGDGDHFELLQSHDS